MDKIFIVFAQWEFEGNLPLVSFTSESLAEEFVSRCEEYQKTEPEDDIDVWMANHPAFHYLKAGDHLCGVESFYFLSPPIVRKSLTGLDLISAERDRQVEEEQWTPDHDDKHWDGSLARAAACYASPIKIFCRRESPDGVSFDDPWPWDSKWDKRFSYGERRENSGNSRPHPKTYTPVERIDLLKKAGALIAAEIDRLIRKDGFKACPYCGSDIIYRDRCDDARDVAHCDDCGQEFPGDVYRQIIASENE